MIVSGSRTALRDWAESGAMWLTGQAGGPPQLVSGAPATAVRTGLDQLRAAAESAGADGSRLPDHRLLGERAALGGLARRGRISAGGATRLLDAADGVVAIALARTSDLEALPALTESPADGEPWDVLTRWCAENSAADIVERAALLGIACGRLPTAGGTAAVAVPDVAVPDVAAPDVAAPDVAAPDVAAPDVAAPDVAAPDVAAPDVAAPDVAAPASTPPAVAPRDDLVVVDLSALWAGPLAAHLLHLLGARVIGVESPHRPDPSRYSQPAFHDLLHRGTDQRRIDFRTRAGIDELRRLLEAADLVIEASRPRALQQLGIDAETLAAEHGVTWLSITAYGREDPRVGFGDDVAIAAGLAGAGPVFAGDAMADPITGVQAAVLGYPAALSGNAGVVEVSMHDCVAGTVGPAPEAAVVEGDGEWYVDAGSALIPVARPAARVRA